MFVIECVRRIVLQAGADPGDVSWTRFQCRYPTREEAEDEMFWIEREEPYYAWRVAEESPS